MTIKYLDSKRISGTSTGVVNGYSISSASYDSVSFSIASQETNSAGLAFNSDGTKMYITGYNSDSVYQYTLSTSWDLSTASYDSVSFSVASQDTLPLGLAFNSDGTKMYITGLSNDTVYQYSLSTGWDLSTASYDSVSFSVASQDTAPLVIAFNDDGTKMYMVGNTGDSVYQYSLSIGWDLSTASYDSVSFSVASQDTVPEGLTFNPDGTKMYIVGSANDYVYQYSLSTGWDLSTASYDSVSFYVTQDTSPADIVFNSDGTKMYIIGYANDKVYQYTTTSTASDSTLLTNVQDNSIFVEKDTGNRYWYDGSDWTWENSPTRGLSGGGRTETNVIEYITIATTGNATDFGDLTLARYGVAGYSSETRGCWSGGYGGGFSNIIDYVTIATTGNAIDFGDLTTATFRHCGVSNLTRGVVGGGNNTNVMDYVTIATTGNATDFGDLTTIKNSMAGNGITNTTRGIFSEGDSLANVTDYITIATTGNAIDFGDLTVIRSNSAGVSSETRGCWIGGNATGTSSNVIDYVTISTTGNAIDFGDLTVGTRTLAGCSSLVRGVSMGGYTSSNTNVMDYITISTTGNATDFGDLTAIRANAGNQA